MPDGPHRDPAWWESLATRWQGALAAWSALGIVVGGYALRAVKLWRKLRRAARETIHSDPPPAPVSVREPSTEIQVVRVETPHDGDPYAEVIRDLTKSLRRALEEVSAMDRRLRDSEHRCRLELDRMQRQLSAAERRIAELEHEQATMKAERGVA
jgi:hypothetical protein